MTSDENPADVIEQAAKVLVEHRLQYDNTGGHRGILGGWNRYCICGWHGVDHEPSDRVFEHHVAEQVTGLLADPADRYEPYDQLDNQRNLWAKQCHEAEARAERAEAEVARLSMAKVNQRDAETEAANAVSDLATAEAEVARLAGALTARSAALNARIDSAEKIARDVMRERDELRATVDRVAKLADQVEGSCDFTYGGVCGTHGCDVEDYRGHGRECAQVADLRAALDGGES